MLEGMRELVHDGSGNLCDLLKDSYMERSSLGILLSVPGQSVSLASLPGVIVRGLTLGGPAYLSGKVQVFLSQSPFSTENSILDPRL